MNVYISCHHPDPANELAAVLVANYQRVVSEWHKGAEKRPEPDDSRGWSIKADINFGLIRHLADVLVLIAGPEKVTGGKFVEAGYALGAGKRVIVLGRVENGMLWHPSIEHAASAEDVMQFLQRT